MKKGIFFIILSFTCLQLSAQELKSTFLFDLEINLDPPQAVGPVLKGTRLIFPFREGVVKGDNINGAILGCSGEWGLALDSATFKMDARATIKTTDGALIYMAYSGYNYGSGKSAALLQAGKGHELSPADYYFRSTPVFETSAPQYAWLNHTVAVGVGRFAAPGKIIYRIYAIQ
ncbi:DUF3237 domain-containing protein [Chitinophaga varians]|uniref:DUF3237 domain-containing protein n=1 Tax=Chitinophaga varians TaxID=2202339 RepID=UPI00165F49DE|nr:DUF3237 domain-containing protein [Chitinophaga varians]MBC9914512.1 DUF3237 domain-containing protein [Chitinophaga varians]